MEVRARIRPGQNGRKHYTRQYGDPLVCVRYRHDKRRQKGLTTAELIVDEQDWIQGVIISPAKLVPLRVACGEKDRREKVKEAGAFSDSENKCWKLSFRRVYALGLGKRMIDELDDLD